MLKDEILKILEENCGESVSGSDIGKRLHLTRSAVWKAVKMLRADGFDIQAVTNRGYIFTQRNEIITVSGIKKELTAKILGNEILLLKTVDSTNDYVKSVAQNGTAEGFTVIANEQTKGKGRLGRSFSSPEGNGIYMTVLLRSEDVALVTVAAAVAVAQALTDTAGFTPDIKWINDIYYKGKKLCGILTEASLECESGRIQYITVGIGINISPVERKLPPELHDTAASVFDIIGYEAPRNLLIANILNDLELCFTELRQDKKSLLEKYRKHLFILGKTVILSSEGSCETVTAVDIDENARLIVKYGDGMLKTVNSGEVSLTL